MEIKPIHPEDRIQLKKPHPCGGTVFRVIRVGSDVRIICDTCGRDMTLDRVKLEKAIKKIFPPPAAEPPRNDTETETKS